jgi:predicted DNA-binding transcriptional regulator AlpA
MRRKTRILEREMPPRLINRDTACRLTGLTRRQQWDRAKAGRWPRAVPAGNQLRLFVRDEVMKLRPWQTQTIVDPLEIEFMSRNETENETDGPRLINEREVEYLTGLRPTQQRKLEDRGMFPRRVQLPGYKRRSAMRVRGEILAWIEARIAARDSAA